MHLPLGLCKHDRQKFLTLGVNWKTHRVHLHNDGVDFLTRQFELFRTIFQYLHSIWYALRLHSLLIAMARELLWNADWPAHAAQSLGIDDPFSYLPVGYAHRLRQREEQKKMKINQDAALISQNLGFFLDNETPSSDPM